VSASVAFAVALVALDLVAIVRAVWRGRGVTATLAWIFAILVIPVVGALAYLLVANPGIRRTTRRRRLVVDSRRGRSNIGAAAATPGAALVVCARATGMATTAGNTCVLLAEAAAAFAEIADALRSARSTIWVEKYIIRGDATGRQFLDLLAERARAGVEVRLLYDAVGSFWLGRRQLAELRGAGARVEEFLPLNPLRRRWAVHLRNHRKLVVIDGADAFSGGMNIGDEYAGRVRSPEFLFRDTHMRVRGPAVTQLAEVFVEDWEFATGELLELPQFSPSNGDATVAVVPSGPDQEHNASAFAYFSAITQAARTCYLTSPYFVPDEPLVRALCAAAMRGVDMRILVPRRNDVRLVAAAARSYYRPLLECGVRIYEYLPSMLHAKTLVTDSSLGIVGSANADVRSFGLNFELGVVVESPTIAADLDDRFTDSLSQSREVTLDDIHRAPTLRRLGWQLARLLSPVL
jgi:cardiolipin synthase A/B